MTRLLERAFKAASELPSEEQDALASRVLNEIAWEEKWDSALERDPEKLKKLAAQARDEIRAGKTRFCPTA